MRPHVVLLSLLLPLAGLPALTPPATAQERPATAEVVVFGTGASEPLQASVPRNRAPVPLGGATTRLVSLSASAVGDRLVSLSDTGLQLTAVVETSSGAGVASVPVASDADEPRWGAYAAVLSPSGRRLAHTVREGMTGVRLLDLAGGAGRDVAVDGITTSLAFLSEDLLLVKGSAGFSVVSFSGATGPVVSGLEQGAARFALDPAGQRLVYVTGTPNTAIRVAPLSLTGGRVVLGGATTVVQGQEVLSAPVFSRDGNHVLFSGRRNARVQVLTGAVDGSREPYEYGQYGGGAPSHVAVGGGALAGRGGRAPPTPAQPPSFVGVVLDGARAHVTLRPPTEPFAYATVVRRTSPGLPDAEAYVFEDRLSFLDQGLVPGRTYTYTARYRTIYLENGPGADTQVVATSPPALSAPDPTSGGSTTGAFALQVAATGNADDTRYSVDARVQGTSAWGRRATLTTAPALGFPGAPGQTYAFRGQAHDRFGNPTVVRRSDRVVVPLDQQRATVAGSTVTVPRAGAYGGTSLFLRAPGATAALRSAGDRLQVVGERCPTCGVVDVYLDGVRRARVDTRAAVRAPRQVLWSSPVQFSNRVRTLALRAVGTAGRPTVVVDAFGARRYEPPLGASLRSGEALLPGESLTSRSGAYSLVMQGDGNLVLYAVGAGPAWFRPLPRGTRLAVQRDGNVVGYPPPGRPPSFQTGTAGNGLVTLVLQDDGNLVLYRDSDGRPLWSRRTGKAS